MVIRKVIINHKNKKIMIPDEGEFKDGLNAVYSNDNNAGKTNFTRAIFSVFFSRSMPFPKQELFMGNIVSVKVKFEHKGTTYALFSNFSEIILQDKGGVINHFDNNNDLLGFLYDGFPSSDQFKASVVGSFLYLDQDLEQDSKILWPSLWQDRSKLEKVKLWLLESYKDINFTEYKDMLSGLKKQLKIIDEKIETLKKYDESSYTGNASFDLEKGREKNLELKRKKLEYKKTLRIIKSNDSKIFHLNQMLTSSTKVAKADSVYIGAFDPITKKRIPVLVSFDDVFNFSREPLKEISKDAKLQINEITAVQKVLKEKLARLSPEIEDKSELSPPTFDYKELTDKYKVLKNAIDSETEKKAKYKESQSNTHKAIKEMNTVIQKDFVEIRKWFNGFDSEAGTDIFLNKLVSYLAVAQNIKTIDFPIVIDSIKEKDISDVNVEKLMLKLEGISGSSKKQIFVTLTSPKNKFKKKYNVTELLKENNKDGQ